MAKLGHQTLGFELDGIIIEVCSLNWLKVEIEMILICRIWFKALRGATAVQMTQCPFLLTLR